MQEAIYRIVDMQMADGSFGMWGPYSSPAAEWLQGYATRLPAAGARPEDGGAGGLAAARR